MLTPNQINSLSYTDFVGLINQRNVLPGSFVTLSKWIQFGFVDHSSRLLEMACTTGFSIREIANITQCSGVGIDLSEKSIQTARINQEEYGQGNDIEYHCVNGYEFTTDEKFSHIVVGAALKFFPDQPLIVEKITDLLRDEGFLLASPFFVHETIPNALVEEAREVFGITVTNESYKEVMSLYNKFEILYEDINYPEQETDEEIAYYAQCTIDRFVQDQYKGELPDDVYDALINRLIRIKTMSNKLRPYQGYSVLVLRYREAIYPNRFVELF